MECTFYKLPPNLPLDLERLRIALEAFPDASRVAVEFRHASWNCEGVWNLLQKMGVSYVCVDSPERDLAARLTGQRAYIRLHGKRDWYRYDYSMSELKRVARIAQSFSAQGAGEVYVFFNNDIGGNARMLQEIIAELADPGIETFGKFDNQKPKS